MSARIRRAVPDDAAEVFALIRELAEYERLAHSVESTPDMIAAALFGPDPKVFCDIAEWNGAPAGFALWFYSFSTFVGRHGIYLEDVFVRPAFRGLGLGKALLATLARRCVSVRLGRLEWSVLDWNEPAIAFYRANGAEFMDKWTTCRLTDAGLERLAGYETDALRGVTPGRPGCE